MGYVRIGGEAYSWYGTTWDTERDGVTKFGGNEITVVKGGLERLAQFSDTPETHLAVTQTADVIGAYQTINATIARATFDVIQGRAHNGEFLSGVTDPSIRPSASSPAEIRAIELFERDFPDADAITTRVIYDYGHFLREDHFTDRQLFTRSKKTSIFVDLVSVV